MNENFKEYLLRITSASSMVETEVIQPLWSNYGKVSRYALTDSSFKSVVVKFISLDQHGKHPRGWNTSNSHNRKVKSYEVETYWYEQWNQLCNNDCKTPQFIGSFSEGKNRWVVLEDLKDEFPLKKEQLKLSEMKVCLSWLANFHATFLNKTPDGLWEIGSYWHLKTRKNEFDALEHQELKSKAHIIDKQLNQSKYQTIVHGDAKLANFCFSENGEQIAAVDFQYVGGGCGMKDVVYFIGSCLNGKDTELFQDELLDYYFAALKAALKNSPFSNEVEAIELEWRKMYPLASADFTRFLLGWMPSHQKVNDFSIKTLENVLRNTKGALNK